MFLRVLKVLPFLNQCVNTPRLCMWKCIFNWVALPTDQLMKMEVDKGSSLVVLWHFQAPAVAPGYLCQLDYELAEYLWKVLNRFYVCVSLHVPREGVTLWLRQQQTTLLIAAVINVLQITVSIFDFAAVWKFWDLMMVQQTTLFLLLNLQMFFVWSFIYQ